MAAVTNLPFRLLCKRYGAGMAFTEQINATHLSKMPELLLDEKFFPIKTCSGEKPVALQLFGSNESDFVKAIDLAGKNFDLININCACPSYRVTNSGAGASLLKDPEKIVSILHSIKSVSTKPVTLKLRLGWNKNESLNFVKLLEKNGCDALIVHARTASQGFSGKADWNAIKEIVECVSIPVVANGDVKDGKSALEILSKTTAEFALIGRAAIGNPLIFREITEFAKNGKVWKPNAMQKIDSFFEYYKLCEKFGMVDFNDLKQRAIHFTKGISGGAKLREKISCCNKTERVFDCLGELKKQRL